MRSLKLIFLYFILLLNFVGISRAANEDEFLIQSESLPADLNFMPTLGNGHLAYTVFGHAIYMNGIFNGNGGNSARARIPNWLNLSVSIVAADSTNDEATTMKQQQHFEMNLHDGYFRWQQNMPTLGLKIMQQTYAHRFYNRALIYELLVQRTEAKESLTLKLTQSPGSPSHDFDFTPSSACVASIHPTTESPTSSSTWKSLKGITKTIENELFQHDLRTIYIYLSENLENGKLLEMPAGEKELRYSFILTADEHEQSACKEMNAVYNISPTDLLAIHSSEWRNFWNTFHIKVEDNLELAQVINAAMFYLASSLPSHNSSQGNDLFYGLSPSGLGRGENAFDYQGHNFWDTEIWMLPAVTQFSSKWTQDLLRYRKNGLKAARFNANKTGFAGARYPWESGYTGAEVIPDCCPEIAEFQIHISTDIVVAMRHLYAVTKDDKWLCENDFEMIKDIAEFLASRVTYDTMTMKYHVQNVMGPDEDHENVTDSVYTNLSFKLALEFASYASKICTGKSSPERWQDIAENIIITYDPVKDYHPEYENYQLGEIIKQADVILMGYPLQYQMNDSTRLNDLQTYESVTRETGPAMTWSMFATNYLDINNTQKADFYFEKSYKNYVRQEFKGWSENKIGTDAAVNFLTGIGGFLQTIVNGYAGVRFYHENEKCVMEIRQRHVLPNTNGFEVHGLSFAGARFDLIINNNETSKLECLSIENTSLELTMGTRKHKIHKGFSIELKMAPVFIQTIESISFL